MSEATDEGGNRLSNVNIKVGPTASGIVFNRNAYRELNALYNEALLDDVKVIEYKGAKLLVTYTKYLLEYLDGRLK